MKTKIKKYFHQHPDNWFTAREIAEIFDLDLNTTRAYLFQLSKLKLDKRKSFYGQTEYRYRRK